MEITSRTQHGRFLMCPSEKVNDLILGVLGRAQARYGVALHAFCFMSNHNHILATVSSVEQMSLFTGFLKGNLAKEIGRLRDWRETFWGRRYHSASVKETEQDQVRRFLYILDNGCKEGLVASPLEWPGVSSAPALYRGETTMQGHLVRPYRAVSGPPARRKQALPFYRDRPFDPASVPPRTKRRRTTSVLRRSVREIELKTAQMHQENGTTPMGARAIRRQKPHDKPKAFKASPAPIIHAANREDFWAMYNARKAKVAAYRDAAKRLKRGETDVRFPEGCFPPRLPFVESRAPT